MEECHLVKLTAVMKERVKKVRRKTQKCHTVWAAGRLRGMLA